MASSVTADTDQLATAARQLAAAGHKLTELEAANAEAGRVVLSAARPPRASGQLAASLRADASANGVTWASSADYWTFVHWGAPRRHIAARPFYVQAVAASTEAIVAVYARHVTETINATT